MKDKMNIQFGEALTADFEENTWTFEMKEDFRVRAGEFAIIPKERFEEMFTSLRGIALSMKAHPDYQTGRNQEFIDYVDGAEEFLLKMTATK